MGMRARQIDLERPFRSTAERWPLRRTVAVAFGVSALLWAGVGVMVVEAVRLLT